MDLYKMLSFLVKIAIKKLILKFYHHDTYVYNFTDEIR